MLPRRYAAVIILALAFLGLGLVALILPAPYEGPLLMQWGAAPPPSPAAPGALPGPDALGPALYLADALGLALLALAVAVIWALALAWERRRHRR